MSLDISPPRPVRPLKRSLLDPDPECAPAHKQAWLLPLSSPSPPAEEQLSKVADPSHRTSIAASRLKSTSRRPLGDINSGCAPPRQYHRIQSPRPTQPSDVRRSNSAPPGSSPAKRAFGEFDPACPPASKHHSPPSSTCSPVEAWLSNVAHPSPGPSRPPIKRTKSCLAAIDVSIYTPVSLADMMQVPQQHGEAVSPSATSRSDKLRTASPLYRDLLVRNNIILDVPGWQIPEELRNHVNSAILKPLEPHGLDNDSISEVTQVAAGAAAHAEAATLKLLRTKMFPIEHDGVEEGGGTPWNIIALPNNPEYAFNLSAPKPDIYLGYPRGLGSPWSTAQQNVVDDVMARPYAQPAKGSTFPFFMIEVKSESAGGSLFAAENQAAGSGSHSVNALLWLQKAAGLTENLSVIDTVAFSAVVSHRQAIFYVHWYSTKDSRFYMSYLKSYSTMERQDIRACNGVVKSIIKDALGRRKEKIGEILGALSRSPPEHWKQRLPTGTIRLASRTSLDGDPRPSKIPRGPETQKDSLATSEG